jgi:hypothetical protein
VTNEASFGSQIGDKKRGLSSRDTLVDKKMWEFQA